ncbi:hypothetical protein HanIR_Chr12g0611381 [Helianthus annuus]|nr:hypothetical protein HanIR_Chr12g0611381 [Helianthus annuus]
MMWVVIRMIIFARWCVARVLIRVEGRSEFKRLDSVHQRTSPSHFTQRVTELL